MISLEKRPLHAVAALTPAHAAIALSVRAGVGPFRAAKYLKFTAIFVFRGSVCRGRCSALGFLVSGEPY